MPDKQLLTIQDLDSYGKDEEKKDADPFGRNTPPSVVFQKNDGSESAPTSPKVLSFKDLDLFGKPGTKGETGDKTGKAMTPGEAARQVKDGVVNHLPFIGATAATLFAPEVGIPAAMGLAGAGGAGGYLAREAFHPTHADKSGLFKDAAIEGATDAVGEGVGRVINKGAGAVFSRFNPESLVESSIMPQTSLAIDKRDRIVQKMLKEREISPDKAGYQTVLKRVGENNRDVKKLVRAADGKVPDIDPVGPTFQRNLVQLKRTFRLQADPKSDLKVIKGAAKRWEDRFAGTPAVPPAPTGLFDASGKPIMSAGTPAGPPTTLTPSQAQALKQGTYRMNRKKYGQLGTSQDEFEKTIARGLAEDIVDRVPSVGPINKDSSEFLELAEQLRRFVGREGNKRLIGLKAMIAAHGVISEDFARAALEAGAVAVDNPHVKVALARFLDSARRNVAGKAVGAVSPFIAPSLSRAILGGRDGILAPGSDVDTGK